jgi:hypothetical protein
VGRQHHVLAFHLRAFADPASVDTKNPWLWVAGKVQRKSPKSIGWVRELFQFEGAPEDMETFLANQVEGSAAVSLRNFFDAEPGVDSELPPAITRYLAWAAARTLPMKEIHANWIRAC